MELKHQIGSLLRYLRHRPAEALVAGVLALVIVKVASLYWSVQADDNWEQFVTEHHCRVRVTEGSALKSAWICADGKIYHRWRQQR